jgi:hypothetical protein
MPDKACVGTPTMTVCSPSLQVRYQRSPEVRLSRFVVAIFLFASTLFAQNIDAALLRHFDYDQEAPFDVQEAGVEHRGDVTIHDISYASPKGGRVPAYLVVPRGRGPFAAVIWAHWYQDGSPFLNRKEFLDEEVALAPSDVVTLLTDDPIAKPGFVRDPIVPPPRNYPFPDGRTYVYSVEWHLITAGTAVMKMEAAGNERKVAASAESSGAVNIIFPVHDRFESRFDPRTFCSLSIFKHSEEGAHKRETSIHSDYARKKSTLDEKNLKTGETKHVENDLAGCATDVITGFYYLQSLPLQPGASYEFPISDGKTTIVRASVERREQIKVPAGTFPAVLITAEATSGPLRSKGKVWVWYSDDASHTPVQMRAKLGWGTLLFRLQRIEK